MQKFALILLMLSLPAFSQEKLVAAQASTFQYQADAFVGTDTYGFFYFIKDNVFIKTNGRTSLEFRKNSVGKLTRADIENPLLMVLFYENFNTAVLLDNQLNEVREINFSMIDKPIVAHAVGMASQNRLWVYDSLTQQIGLYDYLKNIWQTITTPLKETFNTYQTSFNNFIWIDAKSEWFSSDIFGKISELGELRDFKGIQFVPDGSFFIFAKGKLHYRDSRKKALYDISGIDNSFKNFYYKDQILSIFTSGAITNYKITLP